MEIVLLAILLLSAIFIIVAVIFQKSSDEGLSGTIAGGLASGLAACGAYDTYKHLFGSEKDKAGGSE